MYILFFRGNSPEGGPEASVRCFSKVTAARAAMETSYGKMAAALRIPAVTKDSFDYRTARGKDTIKIEYSDHVFEWKVFKPIPEDK